mgnify:CR=1 FL=1|jgi:hypothetical protein|tara:strand:+ start:1514 stop:1666 length:153 start_codon:yes stop_codon:yes gene_type:complete
MASSNKTKGKGRGGMTHYNPRAAKHNALIKTINRTRNIAEGTAKNKARHG